MNLTLRSVALSDPGLVRGNNEDVALDSDRLVAIADGMGGPPAGEVASQLVIQALAALAGTVPADRAVDALLAAVAAGNQRIAETVAADPASDGMGTTLTAVLLDADRLVVVQVGDSRCYLLRDAALRRLTRDDTLVQALVDQGVLTPDEARYHPQRSLVTRALQGTPVEPTRVALDARPGDRLLLCSDGLSDVVSDDAISEAMAAFRDPQDCAEQLVKLAHQEGAPDNVTVVIADVVAAP